MREEKAFDTLSTMKKGEEMGVRFRKFSVKKEKKLEGGKGKHQRWQWKGRYV